MICRCFVICVLAVVACAALPKTQTNSVIDSADIYYQLRVPEQSKIEVPLEEMRHVVGPRDIKVIIHGMRQSRDYLRATIVNSYTSKHYAHVLLADWTHGASLKLNQACSIVDELAQLFAAKLNNFVRKFNIHTSQVHLIGCGLGANIASAIGHTFGGQLGRITGLNPTKQIFPVKQLTFKAAQFVDIIHTACGEESDCAATGSVDFYPNFARSPQPGCEKDPYTAKCDEKRAAIYFAESILRPQSFPVFSCGPRFLLYDVSSLFNDCGAAMVSNSDRNGNRDSVPLYMGEKFQANVKGTYYVITNDRPPFGRAPQLW